MITIGVDLGSAVIKVVFINEQNELIWAKAVVTAPHYIKIAKEIIEDGLSIFSIKREDLGGIVATGYGKRTFNFADKIVDEISANAMGAYILSNKKARTVFNIGGQDIKIIQITADGLIGDFRMNDKCAAGTGRFFEMVERILDVPICEFSTLGKLSQSPVCLNSTCVVFAESEIISLLSRRFCKDDIIAGLHHSIARRVSDLAQGISIEEEIYLDGGPGVNRNLLHAIEEELMMEIKVFSRPQFTVAFGAAVILSKSLLVKSVN